MRIFDINGILTIIEKEGIITEAPFKLESNDTVSNSIEAYKYLENILKDKKEEEVNNLVCWFKSNNIKFFDADNVEYNIKYDLSMDLKQIYDGLVTMNKGLNNDYIDSYLDLLYSGSPLFNMSYNYISNYCIKILLAILKNIAGNSNSISNYVDKINQVVDGLNGDTYILFNILKFILLVASKDSALDYKNMNSFMLGNDINNFIKVSNDNLLLILFFYIIYYLYNDKITIAIFLTNNCIEYIRNNNCISLFSEQLKYIYNSSNNKSDKIYNLDININEFYKNEDNKSKIIDIIKIYNNISIEEINSILGVDYVSVEYLNDNVLYYSDCYEFESNILEYFRYENKIYNVEIDCDNSIVYKNNNDIKLSDNYNNTLCEYSLKLKEIISII